VSWKQRSLNPLPRESEHDECKHERSDAHAGQDQDVGHGRREETVGERRYVLHAAIPCLRVVSPQPAHACIFMFPSLLVAVLGVDPFGLPTHGPSLASLAAELPAAGDPASSSTRGA